MNKEDYILKYACLVNAIEEDTFLSDEQIARIFRVAIQKELKHTTEQNDERL